MVRTRFEYFRAQTIEHAVKLQAQHGSAWYLAGGTALYLDWKNGAPLAACVDINRSAQLGYLRLIDGQLDMGALTSLRTLERYTATAGRTLLAVMCTPQTRTSRRSARASATRQRRKISHPSCCA